jgi:hypothetical protein
MVVFARVGFILAQGNIRRNLDSACCKVSRRLRLLDNICVVAQLHSASDCCPNDALLMGCAADCAG